MHNTKHCLLKMIKFNRTVFERVYNVSGEMGKSELICLSLDLNRVADVVQLRS